MDKLCVFCGQAPERKTKEHVLPSWLIELTGDPGRVARFGHRKEKGLPERQFSFSAFTVPACDDCNSSFGELEHVIKPIMLSLLSESPLDQSQISKLLDWFDKVRVGLWLAHRTLDKNFFEIIPSYHVEQRVGLCDRMLGIFKCEQPRMGLTFGGTETFAFSYMPSCFSLWVNRYLFMNVSAPFLFSRRIGFPFAERVWYLPGTNGMKVTMTAGRNRLMSPILRRPLPPKGTYLFQPMFPDQLKTPRIAQFYRNDYVTSHSMDQEQGVGGLFIQKEGRCNSYGSSRTSSWLPKGSTSIDTLARLVTDLVLQIQIDLYADSPSTELLSSVEKKHYSSVKAAATRFNRLLMSKKGVNDP